MPSKKANDLWLEFLVQVAMPHLNGLEIPICGLCGNTGRIDTTQSVKTPTGVPGGVKAFCICPNGRAIKRVSKKNG